MGEYQLFRIRCFVGMKKMVYAPDESWIIEYIRNLAREEDFSSRLKIKKIKRSRYSRFTNVPVLKLYKTQDSIVYSIVTFVPFS